MQDSVVMLVGSLYTRLLAHTMYASHASLKFYGFGIVCIDTAYLGGGACCEAGLGLVSGCVAYYSRICCRRRHSPQSPDCLAEACAWHCR